MRRAGGRREPSPACPAGPSLGPLRHARHAQAIDLRQVDAEIAGEQRPERRAIGELRFLDRVGRQKRS